MTLIVGSQSIEGSRSRPTTPCKPLKRFVRSKELSYCPVNSSAKFLRRNNLSPVLTEICEGKSSLHKPEVITAILSYIKKNKLQKEDSEIICDDKLKLLTQKEKTTLLDVMTCLDENMS